MNFLRSKMEDLDLLCAELRFKVSSREFEQLLRDAKLYLWLSRDGFKFKCSINDCDYCKGGDRCEFHKRFMYPQILQHYNKNELLFIVISDN